MKRLTTFLFLFLFALTLQGQKVLMNEGKAKVLYAYDANQPLNVDESSDLAVWYEGKHSSSFILDGTSVDRWKDLSGNDYHCNNTNADATRPTYDAATGRVTFIAANSTFLQSAAFGSALSQPNTVFVVYKIMGDLGDTDAIISGRTITNREQFQIHNDLFRIYAGEVLEAMPSDANDNIHVALFNGASSEYWINGILKISGDAGSYPLDGVTLGANYIFAQYADCEICEVIVYNADISDVTRDKLTGYLANKWDIPAVVNFKGYIITTAYIGLLLLLIFLNRRKIRQD